MMSLSRHPPKNLPIAILMGGQSAEHDISLLSGEAMLNALRERGFTNLRPITLTRDNVWLVNGKETSILDALAGINVALLAFHGEWGEDGRAQALMEWVGIPYAGSGPTASALAMDKPTSRLIFREHGIAVPTGKTYEHPTLSEEGGIPAFVERIVEEQRRFPLVVKPAGRGSSLGVSIAQNVAQLERAVAEALRYDTRIIIEDYLSGIEVSCGVLEEPSGELRALPVAQIIPPSGHALFDYDAKYSGETKEVVPAPLASDLATHVQQTAIAAHRSLGCRHYSRTDIILVNETPVVLELNTLPGMTRESLFPKMASAADISFPELIERFVSLALHEKE
jgi:D-alanine-D-alanine ligase